MISDDDVQRAVDFLRDNSTPAAHARAERLYLEQYLKTVKAEVASKSEATTVAERENQALISEKYRTALNGYRQAVEVDEKYRFLREAASAKLEAWRTWSANERGVKL